MVPYSLSVFLILLNDYLARIWPVPMLFIIAATAVVYRICTSKTEIGKMAVILLIAYWAWVGISYQLLFYSTINWAGWIYAGLFLGQAILLGWSGIFHVNLKFQFSNIWYRWIGLAFIFYLIVVHTWLDPSSFRLIALGQLSTEQVDALPAAFQVIGTTPDATNLFTLSLFLMASRKIPLKLLIIPLVWFSISIGWSWLLGAPSKMILSLISLLVWILIFFKNSQLSESLEKIQ